MFSKLTALVAEVVGLSGHQSRPEEFQSHWKAITDSLSSAEPVLGVQDTEVPQHLQDMVELLCEEDSDKDQDNAGTMGPCLEFLLRHKLLHTLYIPCKNNYPPGVRQEVLMFLIHLLGRMESPLLPHVSVHQPVQKQVLLCGSDPHSPLALKEIHFLRTLTLKISSDSRLADFFIIETKNKRSSYLLTEALQRLANHNDSLVAMKAYECLLSSVCLQHDGVARAIAQSHLPVLLASKLQYHFQLIPPACPHSAILSCNVGWGVDYATRGTTADNSPSTYGLWHVEAYLSWLDFLEQAVSGSSSPLTEALCVAVRELLLAAALKPKLTKQTEENILLSTAVLARSIQFVTDQRLLSEFVSCAIGNGGNPVRTGGGEEEEEEGRGEGERGGGQVAMKDLMVQRIDHPSDEVCQVTLQLLDILLQCPLPVVMETLVFGRTTRGTKTTTTLTTIDNTSTTDHTNTHSPTTSPTTSLPKSPSPSCSYDSIPNDSLYLYAEKRKLEAAVTNYLSLVPVQLLSAEDVTGDTGIELYLKEAHQQVTKCRLLSQSWNHSITGNTSTPPPLPHSPLSNSPPPLLSSECPLPPSVVEASSPEVGGGGVVGVGGVGGPLLPALLSKLERLLDQSFEVNLLLTSVLSRLSAYNHPLIDTLYSTTNGAHHSVFSVLRKVSSELQVHADRSPGFQFNLREVRKRLVGQETSDLLSMPHNDLLEGAIVMEEFCKELASIQFAKKSSLLLSLPAPLPTSPHSSSPLPSSPTS